jgi:NADH-quinone oxidoreductase subunit H
VRNTFQRAADFVASDWLGVDPGSWEWMWLVYVAFAIIGAVATFGFVALFGGPITWIERRIAGRIQSRIGPNVTGPQGFFQWLADGLKCFFKEDLIPDGADRPLFRLAPYLVFTGMFGAFVVLPFSSHLVGADLNVGVLYFLAITSFVVVGLLMAGWASNSKWAMFGGIRSAAQLVSYEIPSAFSLLTVVVMTGSLSTQAVIAAQGGWPWEWFIFRNPFLFMAFFLSFTSAIAEGNRTPFDLPEADSEIVAGYNIEYSGMRFLFFLFAEWTNLWIMSAMATVCFLGGWQVPGVAPDVILQSTGLEFFGWQALSWCIFTAKASALVFLVVQLRWTLPRLRVDQLMITCWKYLVPLAFVALLGVLVLAALVPDGSVADLVLRGLMVCVGAALFLIYFWKVRGYYMADRDNYRKMEGKELWYPPYRLP